MKILKQQKRLLLSSEAKHRPTKHVGIKTITMREDGGRYQIEGQNGDAGGARRGGRQLKVIKLVQKK